MKHYYLYILVALIVSCSVHNSNPIITDLNQPPDFKNLEPHHIIDARLITEDKVSLMLEQYKSLSNEARTFENTLVALDDIYDQIYQIKPLIAIMHLVHSNDSIRQTGTHESEQFMAIIQKLDHYIEIYQVVKEYSQTEEAKELTGYK